MSAGQRVSKVSFRTIGCRLNRAETAAMAGMLQAAGYQIVPAGDPCDVLVVHTCTVTRKAERKSVEAARLAGRLRPPPIVVLAGCGVELNGNALAGKTNAALSLNQTDKWRLPELIAGLAAHAPRKARPKTDTAVPLFETTRALLKIQNGCGFNCAYCIVPRVRGPARNRNADDIVREAGILAERGFREMVITGANLGCYGPGKDALVKLIRRIENIPGIRRLRLSSIEPSTVERSVVDCMADSEKMCRYIHLPLQSGDDGILAAMGRRYTVDDYRRFVDYAVARIPSLGLGTDIIAGLPGEDSRAFKNTLRLVEELPFSNLHVFPYSKRPGTPAAAMPDHVPAAERISRTKQLTRLGAAKRKRFARRFVGGKVAVLVERVDPDGRCFGWTGEYVEARPAAPSARRNDIIEFAPSRVAAKPFCLA